MSFDSDVEEQSKPQRLKENVLKMLQEYVHSVKVNLHT